jgi:hypothetical protein
MELEQTAQNLKFSGDFVTPSYRVVGVVFQTGHLKGGGEGGPVHQDDIHPAVRRLHPRVHVGQVARQVYVVVEPVGEHLEGEVWLQVGGQAHLQSSRG